MQSHTENTTTMQAIVTTDSTALSFSASAIRKAIRATNPNISAKDLKIQVNAKLREGHHFTPAHINARLAEGWTWQGVKSNEKGTRCAYTLVAPAKADEPKGKLAKAEADLAAAMAEIEKLKAMLPVAPAPTAAQFQVVNIPAAAIA